jgi:hypothetical protein
MANKTTQNDNDVEAFIQRVEDERKREDSRALIDLMREATGEVPVMWGETIIGFGSYHYVYESGREGDWMRVGFSPRKANLVIYGLGALPDRDARLAKLGKHTTGKDCVYVKRLSDIDLAVLREMVRDVAAQK